MDTPEQGQPYFIETTEYNTQLGEGKTLTLVKDVSETDQYDRLLRYVFTDDVFVNWQLVKDGYANFASCPPDDAGINFFLRAESEARNSKFGLLGYAPPTVWCQLEWDN